MAYITHEKAMELIRKIVRDAGSARKAAEQLDISAMYLSDILAGKRGISEAVAAKLGYKRVVVFEKEVEPQ